MALMLLSVLRQMGRGGEKRELGVVAGDDALDIGIHPISLPAPR